MRKYRSFIIMSICLSLVTGCFSNQNTVSAASKNKPENEGHMDDDEYWAARTTFGLVAKNVTSVKVGHEDAVDSGWHAFITQKDKKVVKEVDFLKPQPGKTSNYELYTVTEHRKGFYPLFEDVFILDEQNRLLHTGKYCYLFKKHAAKHACKGVRKVANEVVETNLNAKKCWSDNAMFAYVKNNNLYIIGDAVEGDSDDCDAYYQQSAPKVFFKGRGNKVKQVICGSTDGSNVYVLMKDGSVWGMGSNKFKLISSSDKKVYKKFVKIIPSGVKKIAAAHGNVAIINKKDDLYVWGHSMKSSSNKKNKPSHKPTKIASNVKEICAMNYDMISDEGSTLVYLKKNGVAYALGGYSVQKEKKISGWKSKPVRLMKNVNHIYTGECAVLLLKNNKNLYWAGTADIEADYDWVEEATKQK